MSLRNALRLTVVLAIAVGVQVVIVFTRHPTTSPARLDRPTENVPVAPDSKPAAKEAMLEQAVRPNKPVGTSSFLPAANQAVPMATKPESLPSNTHTVAVALPPNPVSAGPLPPLTTVLAVQCERVNAALTKEGESKYTRHDLLARYGQSSAASGQFEDAAAAYALFLNEFGIEHPYGLDIAERLASCLAPLDMSYAQIVQTPDGPLFRPSWRVSQAAPSEYRLRHAINTYELIAEHATQPEQRGKALVFEGWVYRARNQWAESTIVWDRCARILPDSKAAADALWLSAQNLAYMDRPTEAAKRLRQLLERHPDDARIVAARDQKETLEAESRRTVAWLATPVESLQSEIAACAATRKPHQVYGSVRAWLERKQEDAALLSVCRWAVQQVTWPVEAQIAIRFDLANTLLRRGDGSDKREAAAVLAEIAAMDAPVDFIADAAMRRTRLLIDIGDDVAATETLSRIAARCNNNRHWEPVFLAELATQLARQGRQSEAQETLSRLTTKYPDFEPLPTLANSAKPTGDRR